jgi:hypothetical protein
MDRSTKIDGLTPIATDSQQQYNNNQQSDQSFTDKKIIAKANSSFTVDPDKTRKIAKTKSTVNNKISSRIFDYIIKFKNNTSTKVKILIASSLALLVPVLGCVIVILYLIASRVNKLEASSFNYTNSVDEDKDNNLEEIYNAFETQSLISLFDKKPNSNISETKVRRYLIDIFQKNIENNEKNKTRIPELNRLAFKLAPRLTDFFNSQSNSQQAINEAIKTVLVYIDDEELYKINVFFEALKNDQQIMATLVDDKIAMATINLSQDAIKNK